MSKELIVPENGTTSVALPAIDLTHAIESAATLGKDGVEVLERLQSILQMERDHAAELAFNNAKNELLRRLKPIRKNRKAVIRQGLTIKYADLAQIEKALREAGAYDLGFAWHWDTEHVGDIPMSVCILNHEAGHTKKSRFPIQPDKRDNKAISVGQKERAATSYADRATLQRVFGISHLTEDTEDGQPPKSAHAKVSEEEALTLEAKCREVAEADGRDVSENLKQMLRWGGVESVEDFPKAKYKKALAILSGEAAE